MVVAIHSCVSTSETYRQIETAELMFGKDSIAIATEIINDIDTAELSSDAERAYYTLIKTILDYCNYEDITSDLAISWCADYYKKHGDKKQYATARHYQSCVQYDLQKHKDAIINEKIAEDVAEQINDIVLLNKVYRQLTIYNYYISNVDETLSYAHNQIATATKTSNSHNQAYANLYLAIIHNELAHFDSVSLYIDKCLSLIKYLDTKDQAYVYSNLGEICLIMILPSLKNIFSKHSNTKNCPKHTPTSSNSTSIIIPQKRPCTRIPRSPKQTMRTKSPFWKNLRTTKSQNKTMTKSPHTKRQ